MSQPQHPSPPEPPSILPPAGADAPDIETTLAERGAAYGAYPSHAEIAYGFKLFLRHDPGFPDIASAPYRDGYLRLSPSQAHALDVIMDKVARILNGNPAYHDNWRDIAGYATLVLKDLTPGPT